MYLLGYDVGTSSVKASLVDVETGKCKATCFWPEKEAPIIANKPGWAEQEPEMWWENLKVATSKIMTFVQVSSGVMDVQCHTEMLLSMQLVLRRHFLIC